MERTWVKKYGSLPHDTLYDHPDKFAMALWRDHGFSIKTADLAAAVLASMSTPANKNELVTNLTNGMAQKSGWKGHEKARPKFDAAVNHCPPEIVRDPPRRMTEDPIPDTPLDERPNIKHVQLQPESV